MIKKRKGVALLKCAAQKCDTNYKIVWAHMFLLLFETFNRIYAAHAHETLLKRKNVFFVSADTAAFILVHNYLLFYTPDVCITNDTAMKKENQELNATNVNFRQ